MTDPTTEARAAIATTIRGWSTYRKASPGSRTAAGDELAAAARALLDTLREPTTTPPRTYEVSDGEVEAGARALFGHEQCARHEKETPELLQAQWDSRLGDGDKREYRTMARVVLEAAATVRGNP